MAYDDTIDDQGNTNNNNDNNTNNDDWFTQEEQRKKAAEDEQNKRDTSDDTTKGDGWTAWTPGYGPDDAYNADGSPKNSWDTWKHGSQKSNDSTSYTGAKDFTSIIRWWQGKHGANSPDMDGLVKLLNEQGFAVTRAKHNNGTETSDDKIVFNGKNYDLGSSLGSDKGTWFNDFGPEGDNGDNNDNTDLTDTFNEKEPDPFTYGDFNYDEFKYGSFKYDPFTDTFNYEKFKTPTGDEVLKADPGYQFRVSQGRKELEANRAAKGLSASGGTLKDLLAYGQNAAAQEYQNYYDRSLASYDVNKKTAEEEFATKERAYDRNKQTAQDVYESNRKTEYDAYMANRQTAEDKYTANRSNASDIWQKAYQSYLDRYTRWHEHQRDIHDWLSQQQG